MLPQNGGINIEVKCLFNILCRQDVRFDNYTKLIQKTYLLFPMLLIVYTVTDPRLTTIIIFFHICFGPIL